MLNNKYQIANTKYQIPNTKYQIPNTNKTVWTFKTTFFCEILLEPLCWMFGATDQSIQYCLDYGRPIILGFTFLAIDMAFTPIIRADGRANISLIGMLISCITNVILDPIFIFVFKWGVAGAAWATIAGQFLNAVYFIVCMFKCKTVKIEKKHFKMKGKI